MFFGKGEFTFDRLLAFVEGLDSGTSGRLLDGFREYLMLRLDEDSNLWWTHLAVKTRGLSTSAGVK
jgi:hypothetical protein